MRSLPFVLIALIAATLFSAGSNPATGQLQERLAPLQPFVGKTWEGQFKNSTPEKPLQDVSRWERALNGQAVRIVHSINDGEYGGETIITWNAKTSRIQFFYFTTAGFFTEGTITVEEGRLITHEDVVGNAEGVTAVKATMELLPGGKLVSKSKYLKKDQWVDGHEITYIEAPGAKVVFK